MWETLLNKQKNRKLAVILALLGTVTPTAGLHKFYVGQPFWGCIYIVFLFVIPPLPHIACAIEAVWYLILDREQFELRFNSNTYKPNITPNSDLVVRSNVENIGTALRELDRLRCDGLISEYEFEQKRRQLIDRIN
ncbi:MAG: SHOCT domain-containing protein [Prochloraceae cyanobacterium]